MKSKVAIFLIFAALSAISALGQTAPAARPAPPAKLPTSQEVVARYVKAIGGREATEKIKSWTFRGTVEMAPMGVKGTFEQTTSAPDLNLLKMNLAGIGEFMDGFDGTTAWSVNPLQGSREKTGAELQQSKLMNNFYRSINLDKLYPKLEVKGIEKVDGKDAYVVVGEPEGLPASTFYFDTNTGLLLRMDGTLVSAEGKQPVKIFFDEMKQVDGVMVPTKFRNYLAGVEITTTIDLIKSGPAIEPAKFAKPKS
jgi:outer membrane lipoprotein-sorting protein